MLVHGYPLSLAFLSRQFVFHVLLSWLSLGAEPAWLLVGRDLGSGTLLRPAPPRDSQLSVGHAFPSMNTSGGSNAISSLNMPLPFASRAFDNSGRTASNSTLFCETGQDLNRCCQVRMTDRSPYSRLLGRFRFIFGVQPSEGRRAGATGAIQIWRGRGRTNDAPYGIIRTLP